VGPRDGLDTAQNREIESRFSGRSVPSLITTLTELAGSCVLIIFRYPTSARAMTSSKCKDSQVTQTSMSRLKIKVTSDRHS
jgi:hypothetical protein